MNNNRQPDLFPHEKHIGKIYNDFLALGISIPYNNVVDRELVKKCIEIIRKNSYELLPQNTNLAYRKNIDNPLRAYIFDVYGTLFISGSGDIGIARDCTGHRNGNTLSPFTESFRSAGFFIGKDGIEGIAKKVFYSCIEKKHTNLRSEGIDSPEVNILDIWAEVCTQCKRFEYIQDDYSDEDIVLLALEYETRINPVWPMGDVPGLFARLKQQGQVLGIVSNAQFYTPLLFQAFFKKTLIELGVDEDLCAWSYQHSISKPSVRLFEPVLETLEKRYGIRPDEAVYVGNDMLNDMYTASKMGLRTLLFAGDRRSLRLREEVSCCKDIIPDGIVISLEDVLK